MVRSEATVELSQIETFSPHILEATLRNTNWESVMRDFFRTNTPRFQGFRKVVEEGGDFDIQMMSVYNDFMQAVETVVRNQIQIIGTAQHRSNPYLAFLCISVTYTPGQPCRNCISFRNFSSC